MSKANEAKNLRTDEEEDEDAFFERVDPVVSPKLTKPTGRFLALANLWGHKTPKGKEVTIKRGTLLPKSITKEQIAAGLRNGTIGHEMAEE